MQRLVDACAKALPLAPAVLREAGGRAQLAPIVDAMQALSCHDVAIHPPAAPVGSARSWSRVPSAPEYVDVLEVPGVCHIAAFVLPPGAILPVHDHPGMSVVSRILYGQLDVTSFDWVDGSRDVALATTRRMKAPDTAVLSTPDKRNVHQVSAGGDAGCAFLDVLTPPYDWDCGRPCNYYRVLPPTPDDEGDVSSVRLVVAPPPSWFVTQARRYDGEHVTWPGQRCEI